MLAHQCRTSFWSMVYISVSSYTQLIALNFEDYTVGMYLLQQHMDTFNYMLPQCVIAGAVSSNKTNVYYCI